MDPLTRPATAGDQEPLGTTRAIHCGPSDDESGPGDTPASVAWLRAGRGTGYGPSPGTVPVDPDHGTPLLGATAALYWLARRAGFGISDQTISVLVRGFASWRNDGWPRGVQEEDRDQPWGRSAGPQVANSAPKPTRVRVRP